MTASTVWFTLQGAMSPFRPLLLAGILSLTVCGGTAGVAGPAWGVATVIESNNAVREFAPQAAVDSTGNAIAVWEQSVGMRTYIVANRFQ